MTNFIKRLEKEAGSIVESWHTVEKYNQGQATEKIKCHPQLCCLAHCPHPWPTSVFCCL